MSFSGLLNLSSITTPPSTISDHRHNGITLQNNQMPVLEPLCWTRVHVRAIVQKRFIDSFCAVRSGDARTRRLLHCVRENRSQAYPLRQLQEPDVPATESCFVSALLRFGDQHICVNGIQPCAHPCIPAPFLALRPMQHGMGGSIH